jgi:PAS domain S-box-containing protein
MSVKFDLSSSENNFELMQQYWQNALINIPQEFTWIALKPKTKEEFIVQVNLKKISLSDKEIVLATVRDITELTIANNELKNSENKLQKIFDILQVGIGLLRNREIIEVNNKTCDITGYSKDELIGDDKRKLYKSEVEFFNYGSIIHSDFSSKGFSRNEVEWIKKDGEIITVILDLMPLNFEVDSEDLILFSILDITDLKKAESEIKELNADLENRVAERTRELELANKELEAFSYSVSHDLRAPLRGIREFSKIILEENMAQLDDDGKKHLLKVINYTVGMKHLIDDLLKLSKLSQEKIIFENINIEEIINSVINTLNDSMPLNKIKFVVNCKSNIVADPSLMRIMITNLNSNAVKFSSKIENPIIEFGMYDKNEANELFGIDNTVFFIRDNGIGFDMKNANKLFSAFQRLHSSTEYEGLGIGLATVSRIIKKHGGKIWALGKINEGATFFFTLSESTTKNL